MSASTPVEIKMKKTDVSFTSTFIGLSGFPNNVGEYISSPIMEFEESLWSLRIYPGGYNQESQEHLSCFVACRSQHKTRASFQITILNQKGWKNHSYISENVKDFSLFPNDQNNRFNQCFDSSDPKSIYSTANSDVIWGDSKFILKSTLKNNANGILVEDKLIVKVDITIYGALEHTTGRFDEMTNCIRFKSHVLKPNNSIVADLSSCLFDEITSDISIIVVSSYSSINNNEDSKLIIKDKEIEDTFIVNESTTDHIIDNHPLTSMISNEIIERIPAHKFILLLRSPVFKAMLSSDMSETTTNEVKIPDFESVVVKEFLKYLYTDTCDPDQLKVHGEMLLAIACKYQVLGLEILCENYLISALNVNNAASILNLADLYNAVQLKLGALQYIKCHAKAVVKTENFFQSLNLNLAQEVILVLAGIDLKEQNGSMMPITDSLSPNIKHTSNVMYNNNNNNNNPIHSRIVVPDNISVSSQSNSTHVFAFNVGHN